MKIGQERRPLLRGEGGEEEEEVEDGSWMETGGKAGVVCVKVTADGVEEEDTFESRERVGSREWSASAHGDTAEAGEVGVAKAGSDGIGSQGVRHRRTCPIPVVEGK